MPPLAAFAPFAPLAAEMAGGLITSAMSAFQARKNRSFQRDMSNTSHQREVADLRAAGLNPVLSARLGGASTPPGAMGQTTPMQLGNKTQEALLIRGQLKLQDAQIGDITSAKELKDAQTLDIKNTMVEKLNNLRAQTQQALASGQLSEAGAAKARAEIGLLDQQIKLLTFQTAHSAYDLNRAKREAEFYSSPSGKFAPYRNLPPLYQLPGLIRDQVEEHKGGIMNWIRKHFPKGPPEGKPRHGASGRY